eukprot:symbB.v1.2.016788.t1/scaffold1290.1/size126440/9
MVPSLHTQFLATRDCVNFACAEDQAAMQVMSLTNSELVVSMLKPFTKLIKAVLIHSSGISRLCRRSAYPACFIDQLTSPSV